MVAEKDIGPSCFFKDMGRTAEDKVHQLTSGEKNRAGETVGALKGGNMAQVTNKSCVNTRRQVKNKQTQTKTFSALNRAWRQRRGEQDGWKQESKGAGDMRRGGIVKARVGGKRTAMSNRSKERRQLQE